MIDEIKPVENSTCYVGLGSNVGDSLAHLQYAVTTLQQSAAISTLRCSSVYTSRPHGPQDQPDYFNAAVRFDTWLAPDELLELTQSIEDKRGRNRHVPRWSARNIDIDILFYGNEQIHSENLTIPHPRICGRAFVLLPLRELAEQHRLSSLQLDKTTTLLSYIDQCIEALSIDETAELTSLEIAL